MFKMKALLIIFVCFVVILSAYHQTDYNVTIERYNLMYVNKSYLGNVDIKRIYVTRYNTKYTITACILQDVDLKYVNEHIQGRKFQSNEYRLFPFNYTENTCSAVQNPLFGDYWSKFNCSVNDLRSCYLKKGCYSCNNINFDVSKFPPFAPRGKFKCTAYITYKNDISLGAGEAFIEIKPTNPLERVIGV